MNFKILQASSGSLGSDQLEWGHPPSSTPQLWLWVNPECVCVEGGPGCRRVLAQFSSSPYTKVFGYWCHFSKFLQLENVEQYPKKMHIRQKENMGTSFWRMLAWVPLFWNFSSPHPSERTRKCSEQRRGLLMKSGQDKMELKLRATRSTHIPFPLSQVNSRGCAKCAESSDSRTGVEHLPGTFISLKYFCIKPYFFHK